MISGNYVEIQPEEASQFDESWKSADIPARQCVSATETLNLYRRHLRHQPATAAFDTVVQYLRPLQIQHPIHLLDAGAAFGYYSEIFKLANLAVDYVGVDYSQAFVDMGRKIYPDIHLDVGDSRKLAFEDNAFDVVLSSAVIMHVAEWRQTLSEAARVAGPHLLLARTPVSMSGRTIFYKKQAYGVECLEIHFSNDDLIAAFRENNLQLQSLTILSTDLQLDYQMKTFLLRKR